jgi:hypothetical protein
VQRSSRLSLSIFDHEPAHPPGAQLWKGGATDLATRTMIADPPRWLLITEHGPDQAPPPPEHPPLRQWALEQINPGSLRSPEIAGGVILVSMNADPAREEEFNDWYNMEHIPHFNRLAGVIAARRFRAIEGDPRYVAIYHVENTDIYATPGWMAANETPWILRMRRFQRDRAYFMFRERIA